MNFIREDDIQALRSLLNHSRRAAISTHTHPDGDALGSSTALALYLQEQEGKEVTVLLPDAPADNLRFILSPKVRYVIGPEGIPDFDLLFLLDSNGFSRTEGLASALRASSADKVLIDHHLSPEREAFGTVFSTPEISSASELLYWVLKALDWREEDNPAAAEALLTGMTTDTNNFANSVFPSTFRMASQLIAAGADRDAILQKLYGSSRENRIRLIGYMQYENLTVLPEGAAYMILARETARRFQMEEGESEGLVNIPLGIGSVRLSVLLREDEGHFRVSVRSKKGVSARDLAQRYFHGGGHENAAGGKLFIGSDIPSPEAAPAYLETVLKTFLS